MFPLTSKPQLLYYNGHYNLRVPLIVWVMQTSLFSSASCSIIITDLVYAPLESRSNLN